MVCQGLIKPAVVKLVIIVTIVLIVCCMLSVTAATIKTGVLKQSVEKNASQNQSSENSDNQVTPLKTATVSANISQMKKFSGKIFDQTTLPDGSKIIQNMTIFDKTLLLNRPLESDEDIIPFSTDSSNGTCSLEDEVEWVTGAPDRYHVYYLALLRSSVLLRSWGILGYSSELNEFRGLDSTPFHSYPEGTEPFIITPYFDVEANKVVIIPAGITSTDRREISIDLQCHPSQLFNGYYKGSDSVADGQLWGRGLWSIYLQRIGE